MTVQEALREIQGRDAGGVNRASAAYAETLIQPEERVLAAVVANIATPRERFPGVAVLTDRRVFAVCSLPGIKRSVSLPLEGLSQSETSSFLNYKAAFAAKEGGFTLTVNPEVGERFSRCLAVLRGEAEEFDAVNGTEKGGILSPTLTRNMLRKKKAREKEAARRKDAREAAEKRISAGSKEPERAEEDLTEAARRLEEQLRRARTQGQVADTDPQAVAARLARELAEKQEKEPD